jgi:hypothetical protein
MVSTKPGTGQTASLSYRLPESYVLGYNGKSGVIMN